MATTTAGDLDALLDPPDQQDRFTRHLRRDLGYVAAKRLPDGSYAVMDRLVTTLAICLGVDSAGWERRYCYQDSVECFAQWLRLQSRADEPTGWVARRPEE